MATPVLERGHLAERAWQGPVVIEEYGCTCCIPPGMRVRLDPHGNIVIDTDIGAQRNRGICDVPQMTAHEGKS
jgi:N-methylhydantoinase A